MHALLKHLKALHGCIARAVQDCTAIGYEGAICRPRKLSAHDTSGEGQSRLNRTTVNAVRTSRIAQRSMYSVEGWQIQRNQTVIQGRLTTSGNTVGKTDSNDIPNQLKK